MKKTACAMLFAAAGMFFPVSAAEYTWTGGGDASKWNDAANWGGAGIPGGGDSVKFTEAIGQNTAFSFTDEIVVSSGALEIWVTSTYALSFEFAGGFSGEGSVVHSGGKGAEQTTLIYSHASTLKGGVTLASDCAATLELSNSNALGYGPLALLHGYSAPLKIVKPNLTIANALVVCGIYNQRFNSAYQYASIRYVPDATPGTLAFTGPISFTNSFVFAMSKNFESTCCLNQTVTFDGDITAPPETDGMLGFIGDGSGTLRYDINGRMDAPNARFDCGNGVLKMHYNASGNNTYSIETDRSDHYWDADYAFPTNAYFTYDGSTKGGGYAVDNQIFADGGNQSFRGFYIRCFPAGSQSSSLFKTAGSGRVRLTAQGTEDQKCISRFEGNIDFVWAPTGDYELELPSRSHTVARPSEYTSMTGSLVASNGTLRVMMPFDALTALEGYNDGKIVLEKHTLTGARDVSFAKVSRVALSGNSRFTLDNDAGLPSLTQLTLSDHAAMTFSGTAALPANTAVSLTDHAVLTLAGTCLPLTTASLALSSTATFASTNALSLDYAYGAVTLDGQPLAGGAYSADGRAGTQALSALGGNIILCVRQTIDPLTPVDAVWTGGAGSGDTSFANALNWEGNTLPDFASGTARLVFNGPATATVSGACRISGIRVTAAGLVALDGAAGSSLTILPGTSELATGAEVAFASKVAFHGGHSLSLVSSTVIRFNGSFASDTANAVVFTAPDFASASETPARVYFPAPSSAVCALDFTNVFITVSGNNPLGGGIGNVYIADNSTTATSEREPRFANIVMENATVPNRLTSHHYEAVYQYTIQCTSGTNRLGGYLALTGDRPGNLGSKSRYFAVEEGSYLSLAGGVAYARNNFCVFCNGTGDRQGVLELAGNAPMLITDNGNFNNYGSNANLHLASQHNEFLTFYQRGEHSRLTLEADDAIDNTALHFTVGVIDLNGHDVAFTKCLASAAAGTLTSAAPAALVYTGAGANTNLFAITGKAGVIQKGTGRSVIKTSQSASKGVLGAAENGTVEIRESGFWKGSVTLADSGALVVCDGGALNLRRGILTTSGDAWSMTLTGDLEVKEWWHDGVRQRNGIYAPAAVTGGRLLVDDHAGFTFIFR